MAELQWDLARVPNIFASATQAQQQGQRRRDELAAREALTLYNQNPEAGIAALRPVDPETAIRLEQERRTQSDRAGSVAAAQAMAGGDYDGAKRSYAAIGDSRGVADVAEQQTRRVDRVAKEAQFLLGLLGRAGPEGVLRAFDMRAPAYGASPQELAAIREKIAADPQGALTALAGAPTYDYQRSPDGTIIGINEATGETKEVYKGTPNAPAGYRWKADGTTQEYIPGGPGDPAVVGRTAGARRDAVVARPMPKSGGSKSGGGRPPGRVLGATLDPNDGW